MASKWGYLGGGRVEETARMVFGDDHEDEKTPRDARAEGLLLLVHKS